MCLWGRTRGCMPHCVTIKGKTENPPSAAPERGEILSWAQPKRCLTTGADAVSSERIYCGTRVSLSFPWARPRQRPRGGVCPRESPACGEPPGPSSGRRRARGRPESLSRGCPVLEAHPARRGRQLSHGPGRAGPGDPRSACGALSSRPGPCPRRLRLLLQLVQEPLLRHRVEGVTVCAGN